MNTDFSETHVNELTREIIRGAFEVSNRLGCGFLEKVYENSLAVELRQAGLQVVQQQPIEVRYRNVAVGEYFADLVIEGTVIVELKAARAIDPIHKAQCLNYLRATGLPIALLLNFGLPRLDFCRIAN